ncbi:MAG: PSD1 and planctomycete cytochrome C domain-containing protein [Bryobacteraceae bacterium]
MKARLLYLSPLLAGLALPLHAASDAEFFETRIRPVLATQCQSCHGAKTKMAGLDLSTAAGFRKGGDAGPVLDENAPESSRLLKAIGYQDKVKMPPSGKLPEQQITDLREWMMRRAPWPEAGTATVLLPENDFKGFPKEQKEHWAFQPVRDVHPPQVRNTAWVKSPIDRFILAKLEAKGLKPAGPVPKLTLLRRATYDLTGLPPTSNEIEEFLADRSPDAFARVVDRLLASPRYGERWGRHWLDVARYADSTGMDEDHVYPHAWRYRDYAISAFNRDLPYDRFIVEQLAGDLLPPEKPDKVDADAIIATGFLALGPKPLAQQDRVKMIYDVVDEQIDVTSKAFLGLSVACARCHDHKFDPILTRDYYSLAGIFASTKNFVDLGRPGSVSHIYYAPLQPKEEYHRFLAARKKFRLEQLEVEKAVAEEATRFQEPLHAKTTEYLVAAWKTLHGGQIPAGLDQAVLRKWVTHLTPADSAKPHLERFRSATESTIEYIACEYANRYRDRVKEWTTQLANWRKAAAGDVEKEIEPRAKPKFDADKDPFFAEASFEGGPFAFDEGAISRLTEARARLKELEDAVPPEPPMASAVTEGDMVDQKVFLRGDHHNPGQPAPKRFPLVLAGEVQNPIEQGSGRLELARWIANPDNPLTSRVMVNRIWQWHFGEGLVRTPNNWGIMGERPTHPELLDYLARSFVERNWSIKAMHRALMLSSAYQMSTHAAPEAREADPANRLWSRFNRRRMTIEEIRDSFLFLDGSLDLTMGGNLLASQDPKKKRPVVNPEENRRRTVYLPLRRGSMPLLLNLFDFGDATSALEARASTNIAPQALFMMNSRFAAERARGIAARLLEDDTVSDGARIERAYLTIYSRHPEAEEIADGLAFVAKLAGGQADQRIFAWQSFCRVLLSSNEMVYLN